ncbi:MAG: EutN/CcmL family microcompartment protein [Bryobacteraceae bacterium]|jgi:microcompartment protein CcmK/EutM
MYLGRVVGCVWSTVKDRNLEGQRLLVIQPLTPELAATGKRIICTDCTGAGAGELIYWVRGREAIFAFLPQQPPTDTTVVGIVDSVHLKPVEQPERDSSLRQPASGLSGPPGKTPRAAGRKPPRKA